MLWFDPIALHTSHTHIRSTVVLKTLQPKSAASVVLRAWFNLMGIIRRIHINKGPSGPP